MTEKCSDFFLSFGVWLYPHTCFDLLDVFRVRSIVEVSHAFARFCGDLIHTAFLSLFLPLALFPRHLRRAATRPRAVTMRSARSPLQGIDSFGEGGSRGRWGRQSRGSGNDGDRTSRRMRAGGELRGEEESRPAEVTPLFAYGPALLNTPTWWSAYVHHVTRRAPLSRLLHSSVVQQCVVPWRMSCLRVAWCFYFPVVSFGVTCRETIVLAEKGGRGSSVQKVWR